MTRNKIIAIVAAGVVALAAIVGGVLMFRGGGDDTGPADAKKSAKIEDVPSERLPGETETAEPEPLAPEVTMTTPAGPSPELTSAAKVPENVDGCDHAYGATICVPWSFPAGVDSQKEKCAWLKQRGFTTLPVPGRDRHGLDPDKNKIACDN
ncbi:hypothetical protein ABGB12_07600 [Actinocorallia sp. B10E7]|uniref:hypothetical protein n=1 Tax=Actinocorallia sp. B10E7 TaxID=3153558 RepID=UPI00325E79D8